jgi:hypothetical protein
MLQVLIPQSLHDKAAETLTRASKMLKDDEPARGI